MVGRWDVRSAPRLMWLLGIASVGVAVGLSSAPCGADDTASILLKGLEHRPSLLQTFEGHLKMVRFSGPASRRVEAPKRNVPALGYTFFYVLDSSNDRWLVERRRHDVEPIAGASAFDEVAVLNNGITASKPVHERFWQTTTEEVPFDHSKDLLMEAFLVLTRWSKFTTLPCIVTEEEVDQARCFCLRFEDPGQEQTRGISYFWIDAARGFAIRKWVVKGLREGKVLFVSTRHAYDFYEPAPGLWLPRRTEWVQTRAMDDSSQPSWETRTIYEIVSARVNEPLREDYFSSLSFAEQRPGNPYTQRLLDDAIVEAQVGGGGGDRSRQEVKLAEVIEGLLEQLRKGPGSPDTFIEPLPK